MNFAIVWVLMVSVSGSDASATYGTPAGVWMDAESCTAAIPIVRSTVEKTFRDAGRQMPAGEAFYCYPESVYK
jgi:hypothetical protein